MSGPSKPKPIEDAIKPFTVQEIVDVLIKENCFGPVVEAIVSNLTDELEKAREIQSRLKKLHQDLGALTHE